MTLSGQLATLEAGGLILLARHYPEIEYLFRHALVHEAAYHSLVRLDRRRLHRAAGEILEQLYADNPSASQAAPALARHFAEAGDLGRALHYYTLAGRAAAAVYANMEATEHYSRALEIATTGGNREAVVDLFLRRGRVLELSAQDAAALENYQALEAWAAARNDQRAELAAINARATILVKPSIVQNQTQGRDLAQRGLALARALGDRRAEARAEWNMLQHYIAVGPFTEALVHGEAALALARAEEDKETLAYVLTDLNKVYYFTERPERSLQALIEAGDLWRELGVTNMLADNLASTAMINVLTGHYDAALGYSHEAIRLSRAIGNLWNESYAYYMLDMLYFDRGDMDQALATAQECLSLAEQAGFAEGLTQSAWDLGLIYAYLNHLPRAFEAAYRACDHVDRVAGVPHSSAVHDALLAYLHYLQGDLAAAHAALEPLLRQHSHAALKQQFVLVFVMVAQVEAHLALTKSNFQAALALATEMRAHMERNLVHLFLADTIYLEGHCLLAAGHAAEAQTVLEEARAEAEALGSRRMLWLILADLATLAEARGDSPAALSLRQQAAQSIAYIAAHSGEVELSATFLSRPDVQAVLAKASRA